MYSFNKYLLSAYWVLITVLDFADTWINLSWKPSPCSLKSRDRITETKNRNKRSSKETAGRQRKVIWFSIRWSEGMSRNASERRDLRRRSWQIRINSKVLSIYVGKGWVGWEACEEEGRHSKQSEPAKTKVRRQATSLGTGSSSMWLRCRIQGEF